MWFGSEEGLNRMLDYGEFDIYRFNRKDSLTISNDHVTVLFEDSQQRFWVGTQDGLNLYNRASKTFTRVRLDSDGHGTSVNTIRDIIEDMDGHLWLINNQQLIRLDGTTLEQKEAIVAKGSSNQTLELNDLIFYQTNLWVGTSQGLYELRGKMLSAANVAARSEVSSLMTLNDDLWIGTRGDGVIKYNAPNNTIKELTKNSVECALSNDFINDITLVDGAFIWVATMDGINVLDTKSQLVETYKYDFDNGFSLSDKSLREVYEDRSGSVWITTPNSGINYFHKADNLFGYIGQSKEGGTEDDLIDYTVFSIAADDDGSAWIGSRVGISRYDLNSNKFEHYPFSPNIGDRVSKVMSIAQCRANYLWLATDDGLVKWTGKGKDFEFIMPDELKGLEILTVMADEEDNLWLGTANQGVKVYSSINKVLRDVPISSENLSQSGNPQINDIKKFGDDILVATQKGLYEYEDGRLKLTELDGLGENLANNIPIVTIFKDSKERFWLGTQQDGIVMFDQERTTSMHYNKEKGVASNNIRGIVEDHEGAIWLSTNSGVTKLVVTDESDTMIVRNYDLTDGLQGNQFSAQASTVTKSGQILMGGLSGVTTFRPEDIIDYQTVQIPTFTGLTVNGEPFKLNENGKEVSLDVSTLSEIELNCEQNNFTINFSALDYLRPDDVEYRYKLEGYDEGWIEVKGIGKASYQKIPTDRSFDFVFQSKGRLSSNWSQEARLTVKVQPHYYQTFWFKSLIVVVSLGLIFFLLRFRENRNAQKTRELEDLVNARSSELRKEIGQRQEVEEALIEALVVAEDANAIKNSFLANMSHELRTPLNGIIGLTEFSLDQNLGEEQRDILRTISSSATSLKLIVDDILDISKIESGKLELSFEPYSVKDLLHELVATFKIPAKKKDISVKYWILPDVPSMVIGDPRYVRQVLTNLISNAVKFTHEGGVSIFAEALEEQKGEMEIWFTVTDTGIGISEESQKTIFDRFVQDDSSNTRQYGGTGLGLSISKELVAKMGGDLWVESKVGKGSIFKFFVKTKEFQSEDTPRPKKKLKASKEQSDSQGRVLLVEDNLTNQKVALKMLANKGMSVTCVENGRDAIDKFIANDYDIILMDLQMPVMDGYEATRQIRAIDCPKAKIPIIALTAAAMPGERERCLDAGMNEYLTKPVSYKQLIDTVNSFLEGNKKVEA